MRAQQKKRTRLDKEIAMYEKDGLGRWQAFKKAWHKLYGDKGGK